ncbi:hypothetical protein HOY82DRAFT_96079 [Tuber indicum]|nr:hypothetical protein HOY82DRAFT_96079 [Tuber indicum]
MIGPVMMGCAVARTVGLVIPECYGSCVRKRERCKSLGGEWNIVPGEGKLAGYELGRASAGLGSSDDSIQIYYPGPWCPQNTRQMLT